jgi:hypothetical protein
MSLALSIVAIILAVATLPMAVYAVVVVKAQQMSTHQIEYVEVRPHDLKASARELKFKSPYDNLKAEPEDSEVDDFNPDEAGI